MSRKQLFTIIAVFAGGLSLGLFLDRVLFIHGPVTNTSRQIRNIGEFSLTNPLLECEVAEGAINALKINFKNELADFAHDAERKHDINKLAIYFRDLNNGPTFGLNETDGFIPASLLKVPVMISYLAYSEDEPSIMETLISHESAYPAPSGALQRIAPMQEIVAGEKYRVNELIERTIIYSDNQAVTRLIENIPPKYIRELYRILGVDDAVLNGPDGQLSVMQYSAFFRILFNSSYLSHENSERALELLTKTKFEQGIVAGVPAGIVVAHKFGEGGDEVEHQIHDCGIVYYPRHPYLLCVMTRGADITRLESSIAEISRFVYSKMHEQYLSEQDSL